MNIPNGNQKRQALYVVLTHEELLQMKELIRQTGMTQERWLGSLIRKEIALSSGDSSENPVFHNPYASSSSAVATSTKQLNTIAEDGAFSSREGT